MRDLLERTGLLEQVGRPGNDGELHGRAQLAHSLAVQSDHLVIVSPDELNRQLGTFIVAPMTSGQHNYPYRIACRFQGKDGFIALEQLRTVDRGRLSARLGRVSDQALESALAVLREMFSD